MTTILNERDMPITLPNERANMKNREPVEPLLLTEPEAARMLSVSQYTLARLAKRGKIPCVKIMGRLKRYRRADLEAFIVEAMGA